MSEPVEYFYTLDGRRGEKVVKDEISAQSESEETVKITEVYEEPKITKVLTKRVKEFTKPFIHTKETEVYDANGVVTQKVESCLDDFELKSRYIEKPVMLQAQSIDPVSDNLLTKDEFKDAIGKLTDVISKLVDKDDVVDVPPVTPKVQDAVADRLASKNVGYDWVTVFTSLSIVAMLAYIYVQYTH